MGKVANVALTDTFDTWRVRSNQGFTNLFEINPTANVVSANSISIGGKVTVTPSNTNITTHTHLHAANTNIRGGTLLINGTAPGTDDNALAFAIALG